MTMDWVQIYTVVLATIYTCYFFKAMNNIYAFAAGLLVYPLIAIPWLRVWGII